MRASGLMPLIAQAAVVADAEGRSEEADSHRQHDHHGIVHLVIPDLVCNREKQLTEEYDGRDSLQDTAEHDEREGRPGEEGRRAARKPRHCVSAVRSRVAVNSSVIIRAEVRVLSEVEAS